MSAACRLGMEGIWSCEDCGCAGCAVAVSADPAGSGRDCGCGGEDCDCLFLAIDADLDAAEAMVAALHYCCGGDDAVACTTSTCACPCSACVGARMSVDAVDALTDSLAGIRAPGFTSARATREWFRAGAL